MEHPAKKRGKRIPDIFLFLGNLIGLPKKRLPPDHLRVGMLGWQKRGEKKRRRGSAAAEHKRKREVVGRGLTMVEMEAAMGARTEGGAVTESAPGPRRTFLSRIFRRDG